MAKKLTAPQLRVLRYVRDHQSMPNRDRAIGDRLHDMKLVQNMFSPYNVWVIGTDGLNAIAEAEAKGL